MTYNHTHALIYFFVLVLVFYFYKDKWIDPNTALLRGYSQTLYIEVFGHFQFLICKK